MTKLLFKSGDDWSHEILEAAWEEIETIAREELKVSYYKPQIEIVTANQMLDVYTSVGMPVFYKHWSRGKEFIENEKAYKSGQMGLAYELVINSDPCIAYLMEENNALVQTLVMAHANVGHSAVFKNNYLFKAYTDASAIVDYLEFAKNFLKKCEEKYGLNEVEETLDACHALQNYGVDKYKRSKKLSPVQEEQRAIERFESELSDYDHVWETVGKHLKKKPKVKKAKMLSEPQENLLYFIEKNAPHLPIWKREIIRIVRKLAQYFSPQRATKVLNEGYATFVHYYVLNRMYEKGLIDGGSMLDFFSVHTNVIYQPDHSASLNPYKLGFSIFCDIKRMCEDPTEEDRRYFPNLVGKDWVTEVNYAMENFNDETFILQYLSPKVARDLRLFAIKDYSINHQFYEITHISDESSFYGLRERLAASYAGDRHLPDIQITGYDSKGNRKLSLRHFHQKGRPLDIDSAAHVVQYVADLWEYEVSLETFAYEMSEEDSHYRQVPTTITAYGIYCPKPQDDEKDEEDEEDDS